MEMKKTQYITEQSLVHAPCNPELTRPSCNTPFIQLTQASYGYRLIEGFIFTFRLIITFSWKISCTENLRERERNFEIDYLKLVQKETNNPIPAKKGKKRKKRKWGKTNGTRATECEKKPSTEQHINTDSKRTQHNSYIEADELAHKHTELIIEISKTNKWETIKDTRWGLANDETDQDENRSAVCYKKRGGKIRDVVRYCMRCEQRQTWFRIRKKANSA